MLEQLGPLAQRGLIVFGERRVLTFPQRLEVVADHLAGHLVQDFLRRRADARLPLQCLESETKAPTVADVPKTKKQK